MGQAAAVYPDSTDVLSQDAGTKVWSITTDNGDHTTTDYDQLGRRTSTTDQRGVEHNFDYDSAGRLEADTVTSLGSSGIVDNAILRVGTTYDDLGRVRTITSYSDTAGTTPVNQVKYAYNAWGSVEFEYQNHDGKVDADDDGTPDTGVPCVQYSYASPRPLGEGLGEGSHPVQYVRLSQVTYPNNRHVGYDYGAAAATDDLMSRLSDIYDDADGDAVRDAGETITAAYTYLGRSQIVEEDYVAAQTKLTYLDGSGNVTGLDRFGRVVDQVWMDYDIDDEVDWYTYTYDRAGNRTSRDNELHAAFDEDYTYDAVNRLTLSERADNYDQSWGLDGLGNMSTVTKTGSTTQTRDVNAANEITSTTGILTPVYDNAGNMVSGPSPDSPTTRVHYKYDAWNRLVEVQSDNEGVAGTTIAEYEYDGANRRIEKIVAGESSDTTTDFYYNQQWQMLETVTDDGQDVTWDQYVYSPRYIDSPIVHYHDGDLDGYCTPGALSPDSIRYYLNDANFNVTTTITTDSSGKTTEHIVYDAYGKAAIYDDGWSEVGRPAEDGPFYCGYFFDNESRLYHVRNRYYDSSLSTWISRDPIGYGGGINLYEYVGDKPTNATDPTGKAPPTDDPFGPPKSYPPIYSIPTQYLPMNANETTIVCRGGKLVVQNNNFGIDTACTKAHEQQHIKDWEAFYGPNVCQGVTDGTVPLGGAGFEEMRKKSECKAYEVGFDCRTNMIRCSTRNGGNSGGANGLSKSDLEYLWKRISQDLEQMTKCDNV